MQRHHFNILCKEQAKRFLPITVMLYCHYKHSHMSSLFTTGSLSNGVPGPNCHHKPMTTCEGSVCCHHVKLRLLYNRLHTLLGIVPLILVCRLMSFHQLANVIPQIGQCSLVEILTDSSCIFCHISVDIWSTLVVFQQDNDQRHVLASSSSATGKDFCKLIRLF